MTQTISTRSARSRTTKSRTALASKEFRASERGEFLAYYVVMTTGILLTIGFMLDAGRFLAARRDLNDTAGQAALAAVQHVDGLDLAQGGTGLGPDAITTGNAYLASAGVEGTVNVVGGVVVVQTHGSFSPVMFGGFGTREIDGRGTARAARGVDAAEN